MQRAHPTSRVVIPTLCVCVCLRVSALACVCVCVCACLGVCVISKLQQSDGPGPCKAVERQEQRKYHSIESSGIIENVHFYQMCGLIIVGLTP